MLYTLPSLYSVFTCELYAIKKALEYILVTETDKSYLLHTDSQSSLQALQDIFSTNALIQEIHQLLTDLMKQGRKITLIWIPSHQGIPGNETVDAAAKEATRLPLHFFTSIPHTDAIKYITRKLHNHWQTSWTESSSSKLHEIVQHCRMKYPLQNFKRQDQVLITRLRVGHTRITHSYLLDRTPPPTCTNCHIRISVRHLISECPLYHLHRDQFHIPKDLSTVLNKPSFSSNLIKFLKAINIYKCYQIFAQFLPSRALVPYEALSHLSHLDDVLHSFTLSRILHIHLLERGWDTFRLVRKLQPHLHGWAIPTALFLPANSLFRQITVAQNKLLLGTKDVVVAQKVTKGMVAPHGQGANLHSATISSGSILLPDFFGVQLCHLHYLISMPCPFCYLISSGRNYSMPSLPN
ncbi:hypothetical protein ANN_09110 [Periplaneta americana]|uniref:RNase H type-1 domain-containing protein n=1 Tax=Periplaneta americana TaxID=6978 RepID=A0ABQ8TMU6_PERAM|nr:hypothetical protein ANN_09110 [Periplaneta americana]